MFLELDCLLFDTLYYISSANITRIHIAVIPPVIVTLFYINTDPLSSGNDVIVIRDLTQNVYKYVLSIPE